METGSSRQRAYHSGFMVGETNRGEKGKRCQKQRGTKRYIKTETTRRTTDVDER